MTLALTRFRLDGIGPPGARFDPLPVDLRAGGDPAATAVLFLENGGGKSVLLRLLFSVVLPGRRQTVGSVKLDGYVGSNDTGHVALEWATPDGPLVTGTVLEWRNRTRSASSSNLVQFWYAFTPAADVLTLDLLPTRDGDRRVTRSGFRERLSGLAKAHPELDVTIEDSPARWSDHLTRATPLDPETFRYQRQMNADEADAESLFSGVRTDDDFVRFVVEAAHDPEQLDGFDELLATYAGQLARRQELEVEAAFYRRAGEVLRPLGEAYAGLATARAGVATARRSADRLRSRLDAGVAHAAGLARVRATEAANDTARAERLDGEASDLGAVAAELRRREAAFRHDAAVAAESAAAAEARAATAAVAAWESVGAVVDARRLSGELAGLRTAQESSERELEPLRRAAEQAAAHWAGHLLAEAEALDAEASAAADEAGEATKLAGEGTTRRSQAERRAGEAAAEARSLRERAAEVDGLLAAARADGLVGASEPLAEAVRRAARAAEEAEAALVGLRARRRELEAERRASAPALAALRGDEAGTEARLAAVRRELDGHLRAAAAVVTHPRTQALAPDATDAWLVAARLEEALDASVRSAESAERAARAGIDDVAARLDRLGVDGLLPAAPDVVRVCEAATAAGVEASTGWSWLARGRDDAGRAKALATNPALAGGVIVADAAAVKAAVAAVAAAGVETETVVLVGTPDQLDRKGAGAAAPVRPALYDPGWTERTRTGLADERAALVERQEAALATLAADGPLLDAVRDLRRRCPLTRRDELTDEVAALTARLGELRERAGELEGSAAGHAESLDALDAEEPDRQAARDAAAEASRRLRDLDERSRAAEGWRTDAEAADRRGEALRAEAEAAAGEADTQRDRAESARARSRRATADAAGRRAEAGRVSDAPATPPAGIGGAELAGRAAATREAYEAERAGRDLTPAVERAEAALAVREGLLAELPAPVRRSAEALAATPGADDPAQRRERVAEARREAARCDDVLARTRTALGAARHTLDERAKGGRRRRALDPALEPADAEAAARTAAEHEARIQSVLQEGRRAREAAADRSEQARHAEARADRLAAVADLLPAVTPEPSSSPDGPAAVAGDAGDAPGGGAGGAAVLAWTAGIDEAREAARAARAGVDEAAKAVTAAERALERATVAVRAVGNDPALAGVAGLRVALAGEAVESLAGRATALATEADAMTASVEAELADTERHRDGIVQRLATLVEAQLRQLRLLSRLSTLPAGLGEWSGKPFVSVGFEQVDGVELTARLGPVVDEAAATDARKRTGLDLLMAGIRAAVSRPAGEGEPDRTFTVRLLRPNRTMTYERATIGELEREFSGGMKLTAAICTYCALAALRANSRSTGSLFGVEPGPLFLDNPLGKASADYLLDLQHAIARRLGVQLVHTTGVWDVEALATYQRVVRLRNLADLRRNVRRLRVDDGVALPGTGPDGAGDGADGGVAGARIDAVSFAVTPPE